MYLDFILDFVNEGSFITVECGDKIVSGTIMKINPALIAIKVGESISIIKDSEITNVPVIGNDKENTSLECDVTVSLINEDGSKITKTVIENPSTDYGCSDDVMATEVNPNYKEAEPPMSSSDEGCKVEASVNEKLIPGVKILGKIDLTSIPDKKRSRSAISDTESAEYSGAQSEEAVDLQDETKISHDEDDVQGEYITMGEYDSEWDGIDRDGLARCLNAAKKYVTSEEKEKQIESNATVVAMWNKMFKIIASFSDKPLHVANKTIVETRLFKDISSFQMGDVFPVVVLQNKDYADRIILTVSPDSVAYYLDLLESAIEEEHYKQAKLISYLLLNYIDSISARKEIIRLLTLLRIVNAFSQSNPRRESQLSLGALRKAPKDLKGFERSLNNYVAQGEFEQALSLIDELLKDINIDTKYKASLLLRRAQAFSSLKNYESAELAYEDLIEYTVSNSGRYNNISHLYTELARLQSTHDIERAIKSAKKALKYNSTNKYASLLLLQLQSSNGASSDGELHSAEISALGIDSVSKMIGIDINECEFSSDLVLKNNGIVTPAIAADLYDNAQFEDKFPAYLEAAKAFKELNVGSYDTNMYLSSVSNYSRQKANYLYNKFKLLTSNKNLTNDNLKELCRLKDSACSYYLESLNILAEVEADALLGILGNYLIMEVAYYLLKTNRLGLNKLFNSSFAEIFVECISSHDYEMERIVYTTIVSIGSTSVAIWNKLSSIPGGTGRLYIAFKRPETASHIYQVINEVEHSDIDLSKKPGDFLMASFKQRQEINTAIQKWQTSMLAFGLNLHQMEQVVSLWSKVNDFEYLLLPTDTESKSKIDLIISILLPYLSRNQEERTTLALQAQKIITAQLKFISENTTYYGRTVFYPLLQKWCEDIEALFEEKIAKAQPILKVALDPSYYVEEIDGKYVNLVVTNIGSSTAEGFVIDITFADSNITATRYSSSQEIPANGRSIASVKLEALNNSNCSVDIVVNASAIYQGNTLEAQTFSFTVEKEPESILDFSDIVWQDSRVAEGILFKGRQSVIEDLVYHYKSMDRDKSYIMYGLTRTGKSSILKHLGEEIDGSKILIQGREFVVCTFSWELNEAAEYKKASDFWEYVLATQIYDNLGKYGIDTSSYNFPSQPRAKDFVLLLNFMHHKGYHPLILVDEFSYIKTLMDDGIINSAFLAAIRQHSLNGLASFIFAGTYDIKDLIRNPQYGITGQLVNSIEMQVNEIPAKDAEDLMNVMGEKLLFSPEAIAHIHRLSGDVPYFIQMICKYCGYYAVEHKRRTIGYPDLENVIRLLTGEDKEYTRNVKCLPENVFQNNQYSASDPQEVKTLISSITHLGETKSVYARPVGMAELKQLWGEKKVGAFSHKLATSLTLLLEKKILVQSEDDGLPVYEFSVDLFRRWWTAHHPDIDLELTTLE